MKNNKIQLLENILFSNDARLDEKDDAIICLGGLKDVHAIDSLVKIGSDDSQDYLLKSSAGEAIARLMIELNIFDIKYLYSLSEDAKNEALSLLLEKKPEWKEEIGEYFDV